MLVDILTQGAFTYGQDRAVDHRRGLRSSAGQEDGDHVEELIVEHDRRRP